MSKSAPSVQEIAKALQEALRTIPGLNTRDFLADTFTPPVALVGIDEVEYDGSFDQGDVVHTFTIHVIANRASDRAGWHTLEEFMSQPSPSAPRSVRGAIGQDPTLGGVVSYAWVQKAGPPASVALGDSGAVYVSVPFAVQVHA